MMIGSSSCILTRFQESFKAFYIAISFSSSHKLSVDVFNFYFTEEETKVWEDEYLAHC